MEDQEKITKQDVIRTLQKSGDMESLDVYDTLEDLQESIDMYDTQDKKEQIRVLEKLQRSTKNIQLDQENQRSLERLERATKNIQEMRSLERLDRATKNIQEMEQIKVNSPRNSRMRGRRTTRYIDLKDHSMDLTGDIRNLEKVGASVPYQGSDLQKMDKLYPITRNDVEENLTYLEEDLDTESQI